MAWEFRDPLFLLVGLLAPLVYLLAGHIPSRITYASLMLLDRAPTTLRVRLAPLPAGSLALATLALAVALAGPRTGDETTEIEREGIAIVMPWTVRARWMGATLSPGTTASAGCRH